MLSLAAKLRPECSTLELDASSFTARPQILLFGFSNKSAAHALEGTNIRNPHKVPQTSASTSHYQGSGNSNSDVLFLPLFVYYSPSRHHLQSRIYLTGGTQSRSQHIYMRITGLCSTENGLAAPRQNFGNSHTVTRTPLGTVCTNTADTGELHFQKIHLAICVASRCRTDASGAHVTYGQQTVRPGVYTG